MAGGMVRRFCTLITAVVAAAALAAPAQGATLFTQFGHGWGHGIGMSQWGALGYAQHGWGYAAILDHYYANVTLGPLGTTVTQRVLMNSGVASMRFNSTAAFDVIAEGDGTTHGLPPGDYRIEAGTTPGMQRVWSVSGNAYVLSGLPGPLRVVPPVSSAIRLDTATSQGYTGHYRGSFRTLRNGSTLSIVNLVWLEGYIRGIVPCEVSSTWLSAAVRAQAVAARSYAYATRNPSGQWDAYADTRSQVYCPMEREGAGSEDAVQVTAGQVLRNGGSVITAFFSSSSGGRTSTPVVSWGSASNPPYLQPVSDPYDAAGGLNPNHNWPVKTYTASVLAQRFGYPNGNVSWVDNHVDVPTQRITSLDLHFLNGTQTTRTSGQAFTALALKSTYFRLLGLTLNAPSRVTSGALFHITGRVWPKPLSGGVRLQYRFGTGAWQYAVASVNLGADGRFSIARRQSRDISFRLVRLHAVSPVIHVDVIGASMPVSAAARLR